LALAGIRVAAASVLRARRRRLFACRALPEVDGAATFGGCAVRTDYRTGENRPMLQTRRSLLTLVPAALAGVAATARPAYAASARKIDRDVSYALQELYAAFPRARRLSEQAE